MGIASNSIMNRRAALGLAATGIVGISLASCAQGAQSNPKRTDVTGIICAMPSEVEAIQAAMSHATTTTIASMDFIEGTLDDKNVIVAQCGMGKVNAGICAHTMINIFGAVRIINSGVAGSLTKELGLNDFVISVDAVQHDYDVSPIGFKRGEIPYTGLVAFAADEQLRIKALEAVKQVAPDSKVLEGRVCSGDQFIANQEQIQAITEAFGGLCAEMEGAAIAQASYLNNTPFVIIRAISDDGDGMSFEEFQAEAARECSSAVLAMVRDL